MLKACWSLLLAVVALPALAAEPAGVVGREFLYETAPFPECHASTIAETPQGLVASWFGGQYEKAKDVGIWVSRLQNGKWTAPVEVANGIQYTSVDGAVHRHPCWNPVLHQQPGGPLVLFFKVGPSPDTWWGEVMQSEDHGVTWSTPRRLPETIMGPVKNKAILLKSGLLLCPTSSEHDGWKTHFEMTSDLGKTWTRTPAVEDPINAGAIQPTLLTHPDGRLQALARSRTAKAIVETFSSDGGQTWTPLSKTSLPHPNSGIDAVTLKDGRHLLVYNHTPKGRSPINLAVSNDGKTWKSAAVLEVEPGAEFSYPAIIQTADGLVHITYTWKRKKITHLTVDPSKLQLTDLP